MRNSSEKVRLYVDHKHLHFMVKDQNLYEVIKMQNGTKIRHRMPVSGHQNFDKLTPEQVSNLEELYLNK